MRILHLLTSPYFSGPAQLVADLARAQRALGHQVSVAVDLKRRESPSEELARPRLEALGLLDAGGLELSVKSTPLQVLRDLRTLRRRDVDVIHAHFSHDHFLMRWAAPRGAIQVRSIHARRSLRWSLPSADGYTVPVASWRDHLPSARPSRVLPAIVGPEFEPAASRATLRHRLGLEGAPLIGMVSTFQPSRRHALGLQAFGQLRERAPRARLVLIGDGRLEPQLRASVAAAHLEAAITFVGYQAGPSFVQWLSALDEVWILGLGNDFGARAAAQARRCGVRVVAANVGALAHYADDLVEELTPGAVVDASLRGTRREVTIQSAEAIAKDVLTLYEEARRS